MATITDPNIDMNNHGSDLDAARARWHCFSICILVTSDDLIIAKTTFHKCSYTLLLGPHLKIERLKRSGRVDNLTVDPEVTPTDLKDILDKMETSRQITYPILNLLSSDVLNNSGYTYKRNKSIQKESNMVGI